MCTGWLPGIGMGARSAARALLARPLASAGQTLTYGGAVMQGCKVGRTAGAAEQLPAQVNAERVHADAGRSKGSRGAGASGASGRRAAPTKFTPTKQGGMTTPPCRCTRHVRKRAHPASSGCAAGLATPQHAQHARRGAGGGAREVGAGARHAGGGGGGEAAWSPLPVPEIERVVLWVGPKVPEGGPKWP